MAPSVSSLFDELRLEEEPKLTHGRHLARFKVQLDARNPSIAQLLRVQIFGLDGKARSVKCHALV